MSIVNVTAVGNLGRDPETREVGDTSVCSFSVACNRKEKGEESTDWYNVDAWGKLGELCQKYLAKGRQVVVVGSLRQRKYEKDGAERTSLDIRATDVTFMGGRSEATDQDTGDEDAAPAPDDDEDIPF